MEVGILSEMMQGDKIVIHPCYTVHHLPNFVLKPAQGSNLAILTLDSDTFYLLLASYVCIFFPYEGRFSVYQLDLTKSFASVSSK